MNNDERMASQENDEPTIALLLAHLQEMRRAVPVNYQLKAALRQKLQEQMKKMANSAPEPAPPPLADRHRRWWWAGGMLAVAAAVALLIWPDEAIRLRAQQTLSVPLQLAADEIALAQHAEQVAYLSDEQKVYTYSFDEKEPAVRSVQLPATDGRYNALSWANRSALLAVTETGGERSRLWVMSLDEHGSRAGSQLLWEEPDSALSSPDWSPDDRWIAFTRTKGGQSEIWLADVQTLQAKKLVDGRNPDWSGDGTMLAYVSEETVCLLNLADNSTVRVGEGDYPSWVDANVLTYTTRDGQLLAVRAGEQPLRAEAVPFQPAPEGQLIRASWARKGELLLAAVQTKAGTLFSVARRDH
ncbi:TolB family protein [Brevibacillus marinus]|uniref:TolB family protein n=1 Tax=Brevibacillus marinus TaxID=2496837 RepID=UPI000F836476|nr:PD40 domain-containing protein [Brevibacillus marinus]